MKISELKDAVALLGFTTELADAEEERRFFSSACLAIAEISRILPTKRFVTIRHTVEKDSTDGYVCYDLDDPTYDDASSGKVGAILSDPYSADGTKADSYTAGHKVYISCESEPGEYTVEAEVRHPVVTLDDEDNEIPLPAEQHDLVPLLTAMYLWMDDEPTKAQYYKALYDEQVSVLMRKRKPSGRGKLGSGGFRDIYGYV